MLVYQRVPSLAQNHQQTVGSTALHLSEITELSADLVPQWIKVGSSCISPQLALKSLNINSDSSSIPYIPWNLNLFSWLSLGPGPLGFVARRQDHQDVFSTMLASSVAWKNHRTWEPETFKIKGQKGKTRFCCLVKIYIYVNYNIFLEHRILHWVYVNFTTYNITMDDI